jgi:adenosylcobinamide kinase / adenosylcobinamide-phosphate guanylyltransferase
VTPPRLILAGGGCRSGKSRFALSLARGLGPRKLFLATALPGDAEMRARIGQHRLERGGDFVTVEEPLAIPEAVRRQSDYDVLVLDCLTLWLANLLLDGRTPDEIAIRLDDLVAAFAAGPGTAIVVTNEVGMGIVPETALGRTFRDVAGHAHQRLSRAADAVYLAVLGTVLQIKPTLASVGEAP